MGQCKRQSNEQIQQGIHHDGEGPRNHADPHDGLTESKCVPCSNGLVTSKCADDRESGRLHGRENNKGLTGVAVATVMWASVYRNLCTNSRFS